MTTGRREQFEESVFPHLEALRKTALWLTMRRSLAEDLVLNTTRRAYREDRGSGEPVSVRVRLFKILTREFFGFGRQRDQWNQFLPFRSENIRTTKNPDRQSSPITMPAVEHSHLSILSRIPGVLVKGAIARLRPHSRLMLLLLYGERFSYAEIGYITDLPRNSVRAVLTRLRRQLPENILEFAGHFNGTVDTQPVAGTDTGESDRERHTVAPASPFITPRLVHADTAAEDWENEGGAVVGQSME